MQQEMKLEQLAEHPSQASYATTGPMETGAGPVRHWRVDGKCIGYIVLKMHPIFCSTNFKRTTNTRQHGIL